MTKKTYSQEFKEQALRRVLSRGDRKINEIAIDLNMTTGTLKSWMKELRKSEITPKLAANYSPSDRLIALHNSFSLAPEQRNAWCRQRGLFPAQLDKWRDDFIASSAEISSRAHLTELRELKVSHGKLELDLRRKERALAETAALLVLQKKFQALFSDVA